ncbi:type III secretion protein [Pseudomonas sp.]|uniref:type III secretion protein n=1 Tax=Pseudomonas sp. TaxID=306 RepID=UPI003C564A15
MTIERALPHSRSQALDVPAAQSPAAPPEAWSGPRPASPERGPCRPLLLRSSMSLRHCTLQNAPVARMHSSRPGATSLDSQLATALEKAFGLLHPFFNDGRLTCSSLQRIANERTGENDPLDRAILVVREILQRPQLIDAILSRDGDITRDSLASAARVLQGNSSPSLFSQDPFHGQGDAKVIQALQDPCFEELRDKTKDRTFLFEPHKYLAIATLKAVMQDPYEVDQHGAPVLEPSTGMPKHKYSELCVYTAKNILERPGLLAALERANGARLFGPQHKEGWLSNKSLDRWLEQDEARKAL